MDVNSNYPVQQKQIEADRVEGILWGINGLSSGVCSLACAVTSIAAPLIFLSGLTYENGFELCYSHNAYDNGKLVCNNSIPPLVGLGVAAATSLLGYKLAGPFFKITAKSFAHAAKNLTAP